MNNAIPVGDFLYGFDGNMTKISSASAFPPGSSVEIKGCRIDGGIPHRVRRSHNRVGRSHNRLRTKRRTRHCDSESFLFPRTSHRRALLDPACPCPWHALFAQRAGRPRLPRFAQVKQSSFAPSCREVANHLPASDAPSQTSHSPSPSRTKRRQTIRAKKRYPIYRLHVDFADKSPQLLTGKSSSNLLA